MAKHPKAILRQKPTNCLTVFDDFVGLALKRVKHRHLVITLLIQDKYTVQLKAQAPIVGNQR